MNQLTYTILGTPEAVIKNTKMSRLTQDAYNLRRLQYKQQLVNQHNDKPLLIGAWNLRAEFIFNPTNHKFKATKHFMYPSLIYLMRFFDEIAHKTIYDDACIIHKLDIHKRYDIGDSYSIFTFTKE